MRFGGIPFDWVERHAAGAVRRGASLEQLLDASVITLRHGDGRDLITPLQHGLLSMNTVVSAGDSAHALARRRISPLYPDIGLRVFLGSSTLEGALQAIARLYVSEASPLQIHLRTEGDVATLSVHTDAGDPGEAAILEEIYLVWMFMHLLRYLGRAPPLGAMTLRDPCHFNLGRPHWGIGALVRHGETTTLAFPKRLLAETASSPATDNPHWECHSLWAAYLQDGPVGGAIDAFVRRGDFVRFGDLARHDGVSPNTLRRRLYVAQGGFRQMRQSTLVDAALHRLRTSDDSVDAIGVELGYSDGRSFRRFLKSATGLTPQDVRDGVQACEVGVDALVLSRVKILSETLSS